LADRYLNFVSARARPNTTWAAAYDLKVFFSIVAKEPVEVTRADVLGFIVVQCGDREVVRLVDGEAGLSARTVQRRLSSISELFGFLETCEEIDSNPVPTGLANRKRSRTGRGTPLVRLERTLPTILEPAEVDELLVACRRCCVDWTCRSSGYGGSSPGSNQWLRRWQRSVNESKEQRPGSPGVARVPGSAHQGRAVALLLADGGEPARSSRCSAPGVYAGRAARFAGGS